jgi:hypothetical protein
MSDSNLLIEQNLYFELTTSEGKEISKEEFQDFIDRVITPRFPAGLTIFEANEEEGKNSKVVSIFADVLTITKTLTSCHAIDNFLIDYLSTFCSINF